jgi:hypothetical protein
MSGPGGAGSLRRTAAIVLPALLVSACAKFGWVPAPTSSPPNESFTQALRLVESGSFPEADRLLRQVASTCESGEDGKRALMLLAAISLDPRNRSANPDSAALMSARYLFLPDIAASERLAAQSVYALALDLGANPSLRPQRTSGPGHFALSFSNCNSAPASLAAPLTALPVLGRESRATTLRALLAERDSLRARLSQALGDSMRLAQQNKDLEDKLLRAQGELQAVQTELQRIRKLLAGPDTTRAGGP